MLLWQIALGLPLLLLVVCASCRAERDPDESVGSQVEAGRADGVLPSDGHMSNWPGFRV